MANRLGSNDPVQIGQILRDARKRQGIRIDTVESETKIRAKYLRALEEEDWDILPAPAYTRGFIRAYSELLGLDSEVLIDEFRRRDEGRPTRTYELAEPVLRERGPTDTRRRPVSRRLILVAILVEVVVLLAVIGIVTGGNGDDERERGGKAGRGERQEPRERSGDGRGSEREQRAETPSDVTVRLVARSDLQACLVDDEGRVLVPDQVLTAGSADGPYTAKRFRLELDPGTARIFVNGERSPASPSPEPAAYRLTPEGVRQTRFTGGLCP